MIQKILIESKKYQETKRIMVVIRSKLKEKEYIIEKVTNNKGKIITSKVDNNTFDIRIGEKNTIISIPYKGYNRYISEIIIPLIIVKKNGLGIENITKYPQLRRKTQITGIENILPIEKIRSYKKLGE